MDINKIIKQGEKEFNEMRHGTSQFIVSSNVVYNWHLSQQHKLLQSIVEEIDGMKLQWTGYTWVGETGKEVKDRHFKIYQSQLDSLKAKLTINIKE